MIEIRITKELGDYEPKVVGPLTMRQTICIALGAPFCYLILRFLAPIITVDIAGFFCIIPAAVAYAFGWVKPYGMKTEKFLSSIFINRVVAPSVRRYKTKNVHEDLLKKLSALEKPQEEPKEEIQEEPVKKERNIFKRILNMFSSSDKKKTSKKTNKKRYKLSSHAFK